MDDVEVGVVADGRRRPRVVVSVTASVDGRVTLNRSTTLMDEVAGGVWRLLHPAGAEGVLADRQAVIEDGAHPEAVLEGSGTFVADGAEPPAELPPADVPSAELFEHHLPGSTDCRWLVVVDSRGRIRWTSRGDSGTRLLVLVARSTSVDYLAYLRREGIPYLVTGDVRVDLAVALRTSGYPEDRLGASGSGPDHRCRWAALSRSTRATDSSTARFMLHTLHRAGLCDEQPSRRERSEPGRRRCPPIRATRTRSCRRRQRAKPTRRSPASPIST